MKKYVTGTILKGLALVSGVIFIAALALMLLLVIVQWGWGLFVVPVFGLAPLTMMQAWGFLILSAFMGGVQAGFRYKKNN